MVPDGIQMLDPSLRSIEIYNLLSVSAFAGYWVWAIPFPLALNLDFCSLSRISIYSVTLAEEEEMLLFRAEAENVRTMH